MPLLAFVVRPQADDLVGGPWLLQSMGTANSPRGVSRSVAWDRAAWSRRTIIATRPTATPGCARTSRGARDGRRPPSTPCRSSAAPTIARASPATRSPPIARGSTLSCGAACSLARTGGSDSELKSVPLRCRKYGGVFRTWVRLAPCLEGHGQPSIHVQLLPQIQIVLLMPLATSQIYDLTAK